MATQTKKFFKFDGSKASFIAKGYHTTYSECIVYITGKGDSVLSGTSNVPNAYVFVQGQFLQDPSLIKFVNGVKLNGTNYEITPAGGASLAFANSDSVTIEYDTTANAIKFKAVQVLSGHKGTTVETTIGTDNLVKAEVVDGSLTSAKFTSDLKTEVDAISDLRTTVNKKGATTFSSDVNTFLNNTTYGTSTDKNIVNYINKDRAWGKKVEESIGDVSTLVTNSTDLVEAVNAVVGTSDDNKDALSIMGVRAYVEDKTSGIASEGTVSDLSNRVKAIEDAPYATESYVGDQIDTFNTSTVTPIKTIVDTLNGADTVNGSVAKALKDAKDYTDTLASGQVKTNTEAIATLNGNATTEGSVKYEVAQAVTGLIDGAPAALDTLKELADYIAGDETGAGGLVAEIDANAKAIELLNNTEETTGSVKATAKSYADAAVKSLTEGAIKTNADAIDALDAKTVDGPASSTANHIATFDGTTGKVIKDSGFTIATSVPANAVFTDTTYTGKDGITLNGTEFTNSGVRSVSTGTANGTISVNTNGTSADVKVKGLDTAAYTKSTDYATAEQGKIAASAMQFVTFEVPANQWGVAETNHPDNTAIATLEYNEVTMYVPKDNGTTLSNNDRVVPSSQLVKNYVDSLWEWEELA